MAETDRFAIGLLYDMSIDYYARRYEIELTRDCDIASEPYVLNGPRKKNALAGAKRGAVVFESADQSLLLFKTGPGL